MSEVAGRELKEFRWFQPEAKQLILNQSQNPEMAQNHQKPRLTTDSFHRRSVCGILRSHNGLIFNLPVVYVNVPKI